jgi:hypothetical protein
MRGFPSPEHCDLEELRNAHTAIGVDLRFTMLTSVRGVIAATAVAGSLLAGTAATAVADPPNRTAADPAGVMSGVSAATSSYSSPTRT